MITIAVLVGVSLLAIVSGIIIVNRLVLICQPNEVLVFSGSQRRQGNRVVGYRVVQGGRAFRIPLLEKVSSLDLRNMVIDIRVDGAYSKGGIPLSVEGVANVKVASAEPFLGNAIVRFLNKPRRMIETIAKETLEGNLRGVLATLTPEEVNQDRVKFATSLLHEADAELKRLGLVLDTLKIQSVYDQIGYLDSLGRKQSADLTMSSRIAEAQNKAMSEIRDAANKERKEFARLDAEIELAKADAERRIVDATSRREAVVAEERAEIAAQVARAEADLTVERARVEKVRLELIADRVKSAEAEREQMVQKARADAAQTIEDGKATASALLAVRDAWAAAGPDAGQMFVARNLKLWTDKLLAGARQLHVDQLTVIDDSAGSRKSDVVVDAKVLSEKLRHTTGLDVPKLLSSLGGQTA